MAPPRPSGPQSVLEGLWPSDALWCDTAARSNVRSVAAMYAVFAREAPTISPLRLVSFETALSKRTILEANDTHTSRVAPCVRAAAAAAAAAAALALLAAVREESVCRLLDRIHYMEMGVRSK